MEQVEGRTAVLCAGSTSLRPAGEWEPGNKLVSHDGRLISVASVCSTEAITTVYNLRVADHHTYFVGSTDWGWDVWVHNAEYQIRVSAHELSPGTQHNYVGPE